MTQEPIVYQTGTYVKLINKAEYCKSIIADGKELIVTGNESGELIVPELKDPKVYITFKEGITNFSDVFLGCIKLTSVPANLFANHPNATSFSGAFFGCMSLKSIPAGLFDNNRMVTSFSSTFNGCTALTGESPYTMVNGKKVHLYERQNYPEHFTEPNLSSYTFTNCINLSDYTQIPNEWKSTI